MNNYRLSVLFCLLLITLSLAAPYKLERTFQAHNSKMFDLHVDDHFVYTVEKDYLKVWNLEDVGSKKIIPVEKQINIIASDKSRIFAGTTDFQILIYEKSGFTLLDTVDASCDGTCPGKGVLSLASAGGKLFAGTADGRLLVFDTDGVTRLNEKNFKKKAVKKIVWDGEDKLYLMFENAVESVLLDGLHPVNTFKCTKCRDVSFHKNNVLVFANGQFTLYDKGNGVEIAKTAYDSTMGMVVADNDVIFAGKTHTKDVIQYKLEGKEIKEVKTIVFAEYMYDECVFSNGRFFCRGGFGNDDICVFVDTGFTPKAAPPVEKAEKAAPPPKKDKPTQPAQNQQQKTNMPMQKGPMSNKQKSGPMQKLLLPAIGAILFVLIYFKFFAGKKGSSGSCSTKTAAKPEPKKEPEKSPEKKPVGDSQGGLRCPYCNATFINKMAKCPHCGATL